MRLVTRVAQGACSCGHWDTWLFEDGAAEGDVWVWVVVETLDGSVGEAREKAEAGEGVRYPTELHARGALPEGTEYDW